MIDKVAKSVAEIDLNTLVCPMIVVYQSTKEYPGQYAARVFDMDKPTNVILVNKSLEELQQDIRIHTRMFYIPRDPEDDKAIIGIWI